MKLIDLTGRKFGRLMVLGRATNSIDGHTRWFCLCDCGKQVIVRIAGLSSGHTRSCGCLRDESRPTYRHGHAGTKKVSPTYRSWEAMWTRTRNRNQPTAHRYVKRGISVVDKRWENFEAFLADMGPRTPGTTLNRKNNNLGYFKENCEWATAFEQQRNKANTKLTFAAAVEIAMRRLKGELLRTIAQDFAVSVHTVYAIATGKVWADAFREAQKQLERSH